VQATHDPLTCLWNRYANPGHPDPRMTRAIREETGLGVVMVDLDHFKRVNDTYGHMAGDTVPPGSGAPHAGFLAQLRRGGRYGGEEFLVVLPGSTDSSALHLADRLRETLCAETIDFPEGSRSLPA